MQKIKIYDEIDIFTKTQQSLNINSSLERGYFLFCKMYKKSDNVFEINIVDFIDINDIGGKCYQDNLYIPAKATLTFIKLCKKKTFIPLIMHTHRVYICDPKVSFSEKDIFFEKSVCNLACKLNFASPIIFSVINAYSFCFRFSINTKNFILFDRKGEILYEY